jgi:hypothetical protein
MDLNLDTNLISNCTVIKDLDKLTNKDLLLFRVSRTADPDMLNDYLDNLAMIIAETSTVNILVTYDDIEVEDLLKDVRVQDMLEKITNAKK